MRKSLAAVSLGLALCLAAPGGAHAGDRPRLVLVPGGVDRALVERLRAELAAMGFEILVSPPAVPLARDALEEAARARAAVAAVAVTPLRGGLELWVVDRVTGKTVLRDVAGGDASADATVALRAVELLRASLMEMDAPHPSRGEVLASPDLRAVAQLPPPPSPPPASTPPSPSAPPASASPSPLPATVAAPPAPRRLLAVDLAPAILGSPGGLAPLPAIQFGARAWLGSRVTLGVLGLVTLVPATTSGGEGSSETRVHLFGTEVRADLAARGARWIPTIGGGVALAWLHTSGHGQAPRYFGLTSDGFAVAPFVKPGLGLSLGERVRLRADLLAGATLWRLVVDYAGRDAARWGLPILAGALGVEVDLR